MRKNSSPVSVMVTVVIIGVGQAFIALMMGVDTPLAIVKMGASPMVLGIAYSAWAIGRAGTGLFAGYLFDRDGGKTGLLMSFGLLALVSFGYGLLIGPWDMVFLRLLQGASAGIYWTSMLALVGHNVPPANRVRRLAIFNGSVAIGGMGGGVIGGWMVSAHGFQMPFWLGTMIALALGILVALLVPCRRTASNGATSTRRFDHPQRMFGIWSVSIVGGLSQVPSFLSNAALPLELIRYHLGASALGVENAALVLGNLVGQIVIFRHPDVIYRRNYILGLYGIGIVTVLGTTDAPSGWSMMAFLALLGSMVNLYSVVWTATVQKHGSEGDTGRATGILRTTGDAMSAASYPLIGWTQTEPILTGLVLAGLLGGGMLYVRRRYRDYFSQRPIPWDL